MSIEESIIAIVTEAVSKLARPKEPRWVSGWEAIATHLRITPQTAMRWADKGTIRVHRKGRVILADLNEIDEHIKKL